jgi:4-diphosphocytidyl-2-C-methyl-D-erythritol kinase
MDHRFLSPAKVNLLLKVVSRRPDGYHDLVSIVDIISIYDVIHMKKIDDDAVLVRDSTGTLPEGMGNTIFRAAMLLKETFDVKTGVEIFVEKKIPQGAGLGGGSSNAATTMKELVRLWDLAIEMSDLVQLGRRIGADVPLFLYGKSCVMRGVGERISPLKLPAISYVVVYPNLVLSTKDVYNDLRIVLTKGENEVKLSGQFSSVLDIANIVENDLEKVAVARCPAITTIKERLKEAGAVGTLMSGSGSAVFGIFEEKREAQRASEKVGGLGEVFVADSIQREGEDGNHRCQDLPG